MFQPKDNLLFNQKIIHLFNQQNNIFDNQQIDLPEVVLRSNPLAARQVRGRKTANSYK